MFAKLLMIAGIALLAYFGFGWFRKWRQIDAGYARSVLLMIVGAAIFLLCTLMHVPLLYTCIVTLIVFCPGYYHVISMPVMPANPNGLTLREARLILGVVPQASEEEIHRAWRERMRQHHPDSGGDDALASLVNRARDLLLEEAQRR